jgi:hypothetical protein
MLAGSIISLTKRIHLVYRGGEAMGCKVERRPTVVFGLAPVEPVPFLKESENINQVKNQTQIFQKQAGYGLSCLTSLSQALSIKVRG